MNTALADILIPKSLSIWERVTTPVPMLFIGLAVGALLSFCLVYLWAKNKSAKELEHFRYKFLDLAVAKVTLNIVDVGVITYTDAGSILIQNRKAVEMLQVNEVPQSIASFIEQFMTADARSRIVLYESELLAEDAAFVQNQEIEENTESITERITINDKIIEIHLSKPLFPGTKTRGWVVLLEDVTEKAKQERQRRLFISTVSHELRTPLTTISGYAETLSWMFREGAPEKARNATMHIIEETDRIEAIIKNLSFLSQIENNTKKIAMRLYDIESPVQAAVERHQSIANRRSIHLFYQKMNAKMPKVFGTSAMVEQMVSNLVNNAIKYSPENTEIAVYLLFTENYVTIKVQDQGSGISKENAEHVFDAFFRVDETGSRKAGGTGLGLAIVKMMSDVQGGTIKLVSHFEGEENPDREEIGSDFYVMLPTAKKTFHEAAHILRTNGRSKELLYQRATEELDRFVNDSVDILFENWTSMDDETEEKVIDDLLFEDDDEYGMIDEVSDVSAAAYAQSVYYADTSDAVSVSETTDFAPNEASDELRYTVDEVVGESHVSEEQILRNPTLSDVIEKQVQEDLEDIIRDESTPSAPPKVLIPDPPVLAKPLLRKEDIGVRNQGAKKKRVKKSASPTKTTTNKGVNKSSAPVQSLVRKMIDESPSRNDGRALPSNEAPRSNVRKVTGDTILPREGNEQ